MERLSQVVLEKAPQGWFEVGRVSELEGGGRLRVLAGEHDVAVFEVCRSYFALENRCPHSGGPLSEGMIHGEIVTCPLHAWRFRLKSGASADFPEVSVRAYEVKAESGRILLRL